MHHVPDTPCWLASLPSPLRLPFKALMQLMALLWMLLVALPRPDIILLQLPPALPTMLVCRLAALRHRARLVFDWHNFAYTLMAIGLGRRHPLVGPGFLLLVSASWHPWVAPLVPGRCSGGQPCRQALLQNHTHAPHALHRPGDQVRAAEAYERYWGRSADASLCVTDAMRAELTRSWSVPATTFHDCPPDFFRAATPAETHSLLQRLAPALAAPLHPHDFCSALCAGLRPGQTICTEEEVGAGGAVSGAGRRTRRGSGAMAAAAQVRLRTDRPALVVSSTSWTPDEDFGPLLVAAQLYDAKVKSAERSPFRCPGA